MCATTPFSQLRRVPPGAWTGVIWCGSTAVSVRMFFGIPGMPHVPWQLSPSVWLVLALATAAAIAGSALLRRRPLPAIGLLIAGSVAAALALDSPTVALAHYLAVGVALGFIVASRPRPAWIAAGMRERVALLHGEFTAEPRPEGGFLVTARLPLPARAASARAAAV
jgi:hypothetical protein